jgi:hypothetical protein
MRTRHIRSLASVTVSAVVVITLLGTRASAQAPSVRSDLVQEWSQMKVTMMRLADAMPEDKFGFKPGPALRTYGEQLTHVAEDNINLLKLLGAQVAVPSIDKTAIAKSAILKTLGDSYDYGSGVLAQQTDASLAAAASLPNWNGTRSRLIWAAIGHAWDEYGVMTVYLRLNGIVPPASRGNAASGSPDRVVGVWRGESICGSNRPACVDEHVAYHISAVAQRSGVVSIRADKIVNGRAETMGVSEWTVDSERHELTWETHRQTWLLKIKGDTMEGTLTLADKTVVRRVTLKRER